jgi:prophage DNA circulation protein
MPMPQNPWRTRYQKASFRGATFFTDTDGKQSGRRLAIHEYPKKDIGYAEDMGKRTGMHQFAGFCIANSENGFDYRPARDALINALEKEGKGQLQHPLLGSFQCICTTYTVQEARERGGYCQFEMQFVEAGEPADLAGGASDSSGAVGNAADNADNQAANNFDATVGGSSPIPPASRANVGGIGHA